MRTHFVFIVFSLTLIVLAGCSTAHRPDDPRGFPDNFTRNISSNIPEHINPQMLEACENLSAGDSCTVSTPMGDINSTCEDTDSGLMCFMSRGPNPNG